MSCEACENHVNTAALNQTGVVDAKTSYKNNEAEIKFDKTKINVESDL